MIARIVALVRSLWSNLLRRERVEEALDEELRAYVDLLASEYERSGMSPEAARRAALVHSGGIAQTREATRDSWVGNGLSAGARELRYALRSLRRSPTFLAIGIATLAIGIGGATAVFTVIKGTLLRPLPAVPEPERLVTVERPLPTGMVAEFSYPDFRDLRARATSLAGLAAYNGTSMALENTAGADRAWVSYVSDDFFGVLGVQPALGRFFGPLDRAAADAGTSEVAVLGWAFWQRRFGGDSHVLGSAVTLNGRVFTVIGVARTGFIGAMALYPMEVFIPVTARGSPMSGVDLASRRGGWLRLIGRLAPGRSLDDAQRELGAAAGWLATIDPTRKWRTVRVFSGGGMAADERDAVSRVPRLLAGCVALLLLIACANVASLSLVRAVSRRRELATRLALGASRWTLVRQVAFEGTLMAAGAGLCGVLLARVLVRSATLVRTVVPISDPDLRLDPRVLAAAFASAALTAVVVSLVPALQVFRVAPGALLKDGGRAIVGRRSGHRVLVALQVSASLVLLASSAMVFSAFRRALAGHDMFTPRGLTYARLSVETPMRDTTRQVAFFRAVLARAVSDPRVGGAAIASGVPALPWADHATVYRHGEAPPNNASGGETERGVRVKAFVVSPGFFDVARVPLVRGRTFAAGDGVGAPPVVIVSRRLAALLWPGQEPVGRLLSWPAIEGPARASMRVVGVTADVRDMSFASEPPLALYVPVEQHPGGNLLLMMRGRHGAPLSPSDLRKLVADVDPAVAALGARTLDDQLRELVQPQSTASAWIGVFGAIALLLAGIGLYGVVAQAVLQRTRELAVRAALGASPRRLLASVLVDAGRVAALGAFGGALGALAALRTLHGFFSGVEPADLRAAPAGLLALAIAVLAASYLPARRAARLNPADALRCD